MSQPNPAPTTFALDQHTRQFFDPAEWVGQVEASFYLDSPGVMGRQFVGRLALLCSFEPVIAMQEVGGDGQTLIKRTPCPVRHLGRSIRDRAGCWREWLELLCGPRPNGCPLPILPDLATNQGISRLHFDLESGFGAHVWSNGQTYLVDLRDVESAEKQHRPYVDTEQFFGKDGIDRLANMSAQEFHGILEAMFRDPGSALAQVVRFYHQSDDARSLEIFGCDYRTLKHTIQAHKLALTIALGPGGEFEGCARAIWHPWHHNQAEAVMLNLRAQQWGDIPAPPQLAELMARVYAALGCQLKLPPVEKRDDGVKEVVDARAVGQEWADNFHVRVLGTNGHEAMEAALKLREMLE